MGNHTNRAKGPRRVGALTLTCLLVAVVAVSSIAEERSRPSPSDTAAGRCDRLSAGPDDPWRRAEPVALAAVDAPAAVMACQSALSQEPENPRLIYQYGRALLASGRAQDAADAWRAAARQEYPAALFDLGRSLLPACDTFDRRYAEQAHSYLRRAADGEHAGAAATLGRAYGCQASAAGNDELAAYWLSRAVALGDVSAMRTLAGMYRVGAGVPRDLQRMVTLLETSSALGDAMSMNLLGWHHLSTARGREDFEASLRWFVMAGPAADPEGLYQIGSAWLLGAADAAERRRARSVLRDAAARGSARAQDALSQAGKN